ncbi:MAG: glutamyl-tRNA reductase [Planctomycetes bacterium]|nr:glutamyl-tRNA reductase [Planctomycetota bacterium]
MNRFVILGISHKFAPLEVRERLAYSDRRVPMALRTLREAGCDEVAILSTCNRVEVIAFTAEPGARAKILSVLATDHAFAPDYLDKHCYFHRGPEAVTHLLRVAGGLDSLVLGETQVLNQVKRAYLMAQSENATGKALNALFHKAFHVAKRLHHETDISRGQLSISSVAVSYVDRVFEDLHKKTALLIGAGEVGELTLTYLRERNVGRVIIMSRTLERAREVATRFGGDAVPMDLLEDYLPAADIVVSQTSSETPVLNGATFARSQRKRGWSPVLALDLAVPRDIARDAAEVEGVFLYNVDDLEEVVAEHAMARSRELEHCHAIIRQEAAEFVAGFHVLAAGPLITQLRARAEAAKQAELARLAHVLDQLPDAARQEVAAFADRVVNKLLHPHIAALRAEAAHATPEDLRRAARLLGLESEAPAGQPAEQPAAPVQLPVEKSP